MLPPWLLWIPLLAAINLLAFVAVRGRWGRVVLVLGLAAVIGVVIGDAVGSAIGLELLRIGDMNVVAASVGAQLAMVVVTLLSALGPIKVEGRSGVRPLRRLPTTVGLATDIGPPAPVQRADVAPGW